MGDETTLTDFEVQQYEIDRVRCLFLSEDLGKCEPLARVLYFGLFEFSRFAKGGLLPDRPHRLRAQILPYDTCDPERLLQQLVMARMIKRQAIEERIFSDTLEEQSEEDILKACQDAGFDPGERVIRVFGGPSDDTNNVL